MSQVIMNRQKRKKRPAESSLSSDAPTPSNDNKVDDDTPLQTSHSKRHVLPTLFCSR